MRGSITINDLCPELKQAILDNCRFDFLQKYSSFLLIFVLFCTKPFLKPFLFCIFVSKKIPIKRVKIKLV